MLPQSFLLFLQGAPGNTILQAFKSDCQSRNYDWASMESQVWALRLFIRHPLAKQYPPHPQALQSFLKRYINDIEEQSVKKQAKNDCSNRKNYSEDNDEELLHPDLLSAHCHFFSYAETREPSMCYKSFVNSYASISNFLCRATPRSRQNSNPLCYGAHLIFPERITASHQSLNLIQQENEGSRESSAAVLSTGGTSRDGSPSFSSSMQCATTPSHSWTAETLSQMWNTVGVSQNTFQNVGLALWPAAFALVQLLSQEFSGESCLIESIAIASALQKRIAIVELGAGVGLTPCVMAAQPGFQEKVHSFCATDYQVELIENIKRNFWINGIEEEQEQKEITQSNKDVSFVDGNEVIKTKGTASLQDVLRSAKVENSHVTERKEKDLNDDHQAIHIGEKCEEEEKRASAPTFPPVKFSLKLLDWNELPICHSLFSSHGCDLILGADCIYDVSVIPAFVSVIHSGLTLTSASSFASVPPCAVVVQTHRQARTMKIFFDQVREHHLSVRSYRAQLLPLEEAARLLQEHSSSTATTTSFSSSSLWNSQKKVIPLGKWPPSSSIPFTGRTASMTNSTPFLSSLGVKNSASSSVSTKVCVLVADEVLSNGNFQSLDSSSTPKGETAAGNEEAQPADIIEDGWIGQYYVSMIDLLGVHIITAEGAPGVSKIGFK